MSGYFITGTDTGVGKTYCTVLLLHALQQQGLRVAPMKPVAAGAAWVNGQFINEDVAALLAAAPGQYDVADVNPYCFAEPIAPHIAARHAGVSIDLQVIQTAYQRLAAQSDRVLVEGAGGFLVPLTDTVSMAEIPRVLGLEVILVMGMKLGCINHALLTVEAIRARGLKLAGWIANHIDPAMLAQTENIATLTALIDAPCLGIMPYAASCLKPEGKQEQVMLAGLGALAL